MFSSTNSSGRKNLEKTMGTNLSGAYRQEAHFSENICQMLEETRPLDPESGHSCHQSALIMTRNGKNI